MKELLLRVGLLVLPAAGLVCLLQVLRAVSFAGYLNFPPEEAAAHVRMWGGALFISAAAFVACLILYRRLD